MNEYTKKYTKHPKLLRTRSGSGTENVHYPLMYQELSEKDRLYAQKELNETDENKVKGISKLKEYMKKEGFTCTDDNLLVMVLRNCKYNIPKSESKLKRFLTSRQWTINKIAQIDMEKIELILTDFTFGFFPWRDRQGRVIMYSRPFARLDKYESDDIVFCALTQVLFILQFPLSSIYGVAYIADNQDPSVSYYQIFKAFRLLLPLLFDMPLRIARVDIINEHFCSRWIIKMLRPFLPQKIRNRLMCHGSDLEGFQKFYLPDLLPEETGGTLGPISSKHYREELLMFIKRIKEINQKV